MTIARLKRATICGLSEDKGPLLDALQDAGCMHLVPLRELGPLEPAKPEFLRRAYSAYRHLNEAPHQLRPWSTGHAIDLDAVIDAGLKNKDRLRQAHDRRDFLAERIAGLEPFGDFALPAAEALRGMRLWFYVLPAKEWRALSKVDLPWQILGRRQTHLYLVLISHNEPPASILPVPRTHTGSQPLSALREELAQTEIEIEEAEVERAEFGRSRIVLGLRLAQAQDADDRRAAAGMTRDVDRIFALQGWVPAQEAGRIRALAVAHGLAIVLEDPNPGDSPPTLLEVSGPFSGARALTNFYETPGYASWDPSLIVLFSFAIFFAMILADAAYAAILGATVALYWHVMGRSAAGRRARIMLAFVMVVAFIYGMLAGSWFGVAPPKGSLLERIALIDVKNFDTMMRASVIAGVLQIALANAEVAWRNRGTSLAVAKIGWIVALFSGLGIWLATSRAPWYVALAVGLAMVILGTAAQRPVERPMDWLLRAVDGLLAATQATKLFGDVLSYMRLFALGLASASLAATFNQLASQIAKGLPGIGILAAILVLLFGHAINVALGILSGVVHGLRLNYIEFFGWALSEEGYPFRAFARRRSVT
jgi:V/A-type H+/Na+-transporting ATPase subunit I